MLYIVIAVGGGTALRNVTSNRFGNVKRVREFPSEQTAVLSAYFTTAIFHSDVNYVCFLLEHGAK